MYRWRYAMKRIPKVAYTLEFKLEALRRVRGGEAIRKVAREIGVPEQSIRNWVKAQAEGRLGKAENGKPITPEQMEISRLRAENARLKMEMEIVKKAAAYFARESL
jgi:transposase